MDGPRQIPCVGKTAREIISKTSLFGSLGCYRQQTWLLAPRLVYMLIKKIFPSTRIDHDKGTAYSVNNTIPKQTLIKTTHNLSPAVEETKAVICFSPKLGTTCVVPRYKACIQSFFTSFGMGQGKVFP